MVHLCLSFFFLLTQLILPYRATQKGTMTTYWVKVSPDEARLVNATDDASVAEDAEESTVHEDEYHLKDNKQLIDFNTDMLLDLLRKVVARRRAIQRRHQRKSPLDYTRDNSMIEYRKYVGQRSLVDHVAEAIPFAPFEKDLEVEDPSKINLSEKVVAQARAYVEQCASLYNDVAFHNFDHASRKELLFVYLELECVHCSFSPLFSRLRTPQMSSCRLIIFLIRLSVPRRVAFSSWK